MCVLNIEERERERAETNGSNFKERLDTLAGRQDRLRTANCKWNILFALVLHLRQMDEYAVKFNAAIAAMLFGGQSR